MSGYEITFSVTALCPCCGEELPSNSYLTDSLPTASPLDRDNPYARKDRRVFITPCPNCFGPKKDDAALNDAYAEGRKDEREANADVLSALIAVMAHAVDPKEFDYIRKGIGTATRRGEALLAAQAAIARFTGEPQ